MEVTKVVVGVNTKMNHRERRQLAKKLEGHNYCKVHRRHLHLHGTQLICTKCRIEKRMEKQKEKEKKRKQNAKSIKKV